MLQCRSYEISLLQRSTNFAGRRLPFPQVVHRRSKMVVAGILSVLTVVGLAMILTAWKTGLVD